MITAADALRILDALASANIPVWLDGGWGVEALLGEQTRDHGDLDLVIALNDVPAAYEALRSRDFEMIEDERPTRCVLADDSGRRIDLHTVVFDATGGGVQALQNGRTYRYPPEGFAGRGEVAGRAVNCLTAEVQIECHQGYEPTEIDRRDMRLLAERFGLRLPSAYSR